jgi:aspartate/methionine/tyrosine aminotransferase
LVWELAEALNCTFDKKASGMFVWAKLPPMVKAEEFIEVLLKNNHIFIAPGTIFGTKGEGYVRFSLCAPTEDIEEAIARIR